MSHAAILINAEIEQEINAEQAGSAAPIRTGHGSGPPRDYVQLVQLLRVAAVALQNPGTASAAEEIAIIGHLAHRAVQMEDVMKGRASLAEWLEREGMVANAAHAGAADAGGMAS